jgi:hypothetical protein
MAGYRLKREKMKRIKIESDLAIFSKCVAAFGATEKLC